MKMTFMVKHAVFSVILLASSCQLLAGERENYRFHLGPEFRQDHFKWSIAGEPSGKNPNILSELEWDDIFAFGLRGGAEARVADFVLIHADAHYGWIADGSNTDSDYFGNNRTGLFSRSTAETEGSLFDFEASVGLDFFAQEARVALVPRAGFSFNRQQFEDKNGYQQVDRLFGFTGPFDGLNSKYTANWTGGFLGLEFKWGITKSLQAKIDGRFTLADYSAEAVWNLRDDFKKNPSFEHSADATGWSVTASLDWKFHSNWSLEAYAGWKRFVTDTGTDTTFFADGDRDRTRLNEVEWESFATGVSISYSF